MTDVPRTPRERFRGFMRRHTGPKVQPPWALAGFQDYYDWWIAANERVTPARRRAMLRQIASWDSRPLVSVLLPLDGPEPRSLRAAVESVRAQVYRRWELLIATAPPTGRAVRATLTMGARHDRRIRVVLRAGETGIAAAANAALASAAGDFVVLLDQQDQLSPRALFEIALAIRTRPDAGLIYADEDRIDEARRRSDPCFKPDFNYELLLGRNLVNHVGAYRRELLERIGGFAPRRGGALDYDLALRCVERLSPERIVHVPRVLCHRPAGAGEDARVVADRIRAVQEHLDRTCPGSSVEPHPEAQGLHRVRFPLPRPAPKVSVVVPTRNGRELVGRVLDGLFAKTRYDDLEVIVVDNGSDDPGVLAYLGALASAGKITLLRDERPFNFAALNNLAVAASAGEYVLLLNNDVEVIEPGWLAEMVAVAARPGVGAVGARLWYPDRTLQHAGVVLGLGDVAGHVHIGLPAGEAGYCGRAVLLQACSAVTAACLLVKRSLYDKVGGLDERNLPVAFNDVDFCLRLAQAGHRTVWTPHAELIHHESASRGSDLEPANAARFEAEARFMREKWGGLLRRDPAFNVNLDLDYAGVKLADTPRA